MRTLNLGILAHVDAGKTSLTERLLYVGGVIDKIGSVDEGSTQTDSLDQERQRGITIKAAVASFLINDIVVNLIDTPGHPDFIAEVERVLNVLDGAVLVISAVEGVQAQTRVLMRTLKRLRIPTVIFVNKIDRRGAQFEPLVQSIRERLAAPVVAMGAPKGLGAFGANFEPGRPDDPEFLAALSEVLAEHDDGILANYLSEAPPSYEQLRQSLAKQTRDALVHPVYFGSAITGAGVDALIEGITGLLPTIDADASGPPTGTVFKVERGSNGEKIAYIRMYTGTLRARERITIRDHDQKVNGISVFDRGEKVPVPCITAGRIGMLWGLTEVQIGDAVGIPRTLAARQHFSPPTLETVVVPLLAADKGALHRALTKLAEQDPLINLRQDDARQEISVSLYGEVQKEVIQETLAKDFGVEVTFLETTTICIERPEGVGEALEMAPDPFIATVGVRIEPGPLGTGVDFQLEIDVGSVPQAFLTAVEDSVRETLRQGLYGWEVTDCKVTMTQAIRYRKWATSTAADHRNLTPLVVMSALKQAGTRVYEPVNHFNLEGPTDTLSPLLPVLSGLRAVPEVPKILGSGFSLEGDIPAARVHELQRLLPGLTHGEGMLESTFDHYEPVSGLLPTRPRADNNPLNRREYLLRLASRV